MVSPRDRTNSYERWYVTRTHLMDIIYFFASRLFMTIKLCNFILFEQKRKATHCSCCIWDLSHLCGEFWLKDAKMWYSVRVVEQFSDKSRGLSESYPSTCSAIGVDNSRQLISTNKMQTKKQSRLSHWRFRTGSLRFSFLFFFISSWRRFLEIFFSALIDGYDKTSKRKVLQE